MTWQWQLVACLAIAGHAVYVVRTTSWLRRLRLLEYHDGFCRLTFADGSVQRGEARAELVTARLTILRVALAGRSRALPLFTDGTDPDSLRRLRVLLRCRDLGRVS